MSARLVLFADPDRSFGRKLVFLAQKAGILAESCTTAEEARRALVASSPAIFFTTVSLGGVRGVALVHLAKLANSATRAVMYGGAADLLLAREAQRAGALFEPRAYLPYSLPRYMTAVLPAMDRRDAARIERRTSFRGGRRVTDVESLYTAPGARPPRAF